MSLPRKEAYFWAFIVWPSILGVCFFLAQRLIDWPRPKGALASSISLVIGEEGTCVEIITPVTAEPKLQVTLASGSVPLLGRVETLADRFIFVPSLPFTPGQKYVVRWVDASGAPQQADFLIKPTSKEHPSVRLAPQATLPANALKFYLHFSEPMEQGIFLERMRLLDGSGQEVIGPFRETELWSPDGRRLTVWFHPGRQKTGVNLNEDEGPVLQEAMKHTLILSGTWRSTRGIALGDDVRFDFNAGPADHEQPNMKRWKITPPKAGTQDPLVVRFDEPLDTAMLTHALRIQNADGEVKITAPEASPDGLQWRARPQQPWPQGTLELHAEPTLEDLAGNSLEKLFEVDVSADPANTPPTITSRTFEAL